MKSAHLLLLGIIFNLAMVSTSHTALAQTQHWRGPDQNGNFGPGDFPSSLNTNTLKWKSPLPGKGTSTPILVDNKIFLTCPAEGKDCVLAFDFQGKELWRQSLGAEVPGKHRNGSGSNASIATDGKRLFAYFKSGTLAGLKLDGQILWEHNLIENYGPDSLYWDHGTSPVVTSSGVVMVRMHQGESWLASFDRQTGKLQWKTPRNFKTPTEGDHGYTSPLITKLNGKEVILLWGGQHLTAHDTSNGRTLWMCGDFNPSNKNFWPAVATPVLIDDVAVVPFGRADKRQPRLHGIRLSGKGDVTQSNRLWKTDQHSCFVPSPTSDGSNALVLSDRGSIAAIEPESGKEIWKLDLPEHRSSYYASPSVAGDYFYAAREDGTVFIVDKTQSGRLVSEQDLEERIIASPVGFNDQLLIRGEHHLMCFSRK
ncbi:PQQ-binding-like beta-propeller repeat protein [Verrucomicrobia bacterium]|nr:PQQ-binding-like beta-propeller repeat protein [Verrucomicrobiota bacterium]MDA7524650.1 PQQ-binding-like beta-propeller repeat protein [Verrucomicrobiota bacterium]